MSIDEVDIRNPNLVKHCPSCGSADVIIFQDLLKCHKCYKLFNAYEIRDEIGE